MTKQDLIDFVLKEKELWEAGEIKAPVHLCGGNEDQLIEIFKGIKPNDYVFSTHRNSYHALLHGVSPDKLLDEIRGSKDAICGGHARSMGFIDVSRNFYSSAIVGGLCAMAVGVAWALKCKPQTFDDGFNMSPCVWCFVGDGAVDGGHFWEAFMYAEGQDLPITFVIEDNDRATCSSKEERLGSHNPWRYLHMRDKKKARCYRYIPTYPHVGSGTYVQF